MNIIETCVKDAVIIEPKVFGDARGFFLETYQAQRYQNKIHNDQPFVQDNHSRSSRGVLRGLHFQKTKPQGKLVRVVRGEVFDVVVDLRRDSPTFGKWHGVWLSEDNHRQFWLPPGTAHGFVVTSDSADFEYKCTEYYDPSDEGCLLWNDPQLNIDWPITNPILSDKDKVGQSFAELVKELGKEPSAKLDKEPSAGRGKEPSAKLDKEPSAKGKEPSAEQGKEPSAGRGKEPSAKLDKEPSAEQGKEPSAGLKL